MSEALVLGPGAGKIYDMVLSSSLRSSPGREKFRLVSRSLDDKATEATIGVQKGGGRGLGAHGMKMDHNEERLLRAATRVLGL